MQTHAGKAHRRADSGLIHNFSMSTLLSPPRPDLGETIRELARLRGLKAYELADKVDLSATAMSQIMNNVSRPRQSTFTRLCKVLCTSKAEERRLVSAYAGAELMEDKAGAAVPLAAEVDEEGYSREADIHRLRAEQYLERKAQSIAFRASVGRALEKAGVSFRAEVCENGGGGGFSGGAGRRHAAGAGVSLQHAARFRARDCDGGGAAGAAGLRDGVDRGAL
jgi:transcriptional regulator with XRE-family HTH domain